MAPTCPQGCFLFFEGVSQLGGTNMLPRDVSYFLKGWVLDFPSSSHQCPIKILLFSPSSQIILIKILLITHQNPFVPINNPSIPFCSHQVLKQFPSNSCCSHQNPFVLMAMEDRQVSTKVNGETRERLRQSAKRSATVCGQAGRGATVEADVCWGCGRAASRDFCLPGFVEDRGRKT